MELVYGWDNWCVREWGRDRCGMRKEAPILCFHAAEDNGET